MTMAIDFQSLNCKNTEHLSCHSRWRGFGFEFICNCPCHKRQEALGVKEPVARATVKVWTSYGAPPND